MIEYFGTNDKDLVQLLVPDILKQDEKYQELLKKFDIE